MKYNLKNSRKGFTLLETIMSIFILTTLVLSISKAFPALKNASNKEDYRLLAITQNVSTVEEIKNEFYTTGNPEVLYKSMVRSGELEGTQSLYITQIEVERLRVGEEVPTNQDELKWLNGSKSEMYKITVKTTIGGRDFPNSDTVTYLYSGKGR